MNERTCRPQKMDLNVNYTALTAYCTWMFLADSYSFCHSTLKQGLSFVYSSSLTSCPTSHILEVICCICCQNSLVWHVHTNFDLKYTILYDIWWNHSIYKSVQGNQNLIFCTLLCLIFRSLPELCSWVNEDVSKNDKEELWCLMLLNDIARVVVSQECSLSHRNIYAFQLRNFSCLFKWFLLSWQCFTCMNGLVTISQSINIIGSLWFNVVMCYLFPCFPLF